VVPLKGDGEGCEAGAARNKAAGQLAAAAARAIRHQVQTLHRAMHHEQCAWRAVDADKQL